MLLVLAGTVIAVMVVGAFISLSQLSSARQRVADRYDPALVASAELLAALVDQETGIRGFVLSSEQSFLEPFTSGREREQAITRDLAVLLAGDLLTSSALSAVDEASAAWRTRAGIPLSELDPEQVTDAQLELSRSLFDEIRDRHAVLDELVAQNREQARLDLNAAANWLRGWLLAMTVMLVIVLVGIAVELRRSVLRPLGAAVDQVKLVADGEIDHEVRVDGPTEFVELASRDRRDAPPDRRTTSRGRREPEPSSKRRIGNSSSSPTSPRTTCRNHCARSPRSARCSSSGTAASSTSAPTATSTSPSTVRRGCRP